MWTRREYLKLNLAAGAGMALAPRWALAGEEMSRITRAIPSSGQRLPVIGLGTSASFARAARGEERAKLRAVLAALAEHGGSVIDTAPAYGDSEEVLGRFAAELGLTDQLFWATKVNVAGRGGGAADPAAARAQLETSFARLGTPVIDLVQVHNLGDVPTQLGILKELKASGRIRYLGVTTTSPERYEELARVMRSEPLDFIGVDYAVDNREVEATILPLARERGIGVLVYLPFGRTRLWARVKGREVPEWAAELDAHTWAQFFLKFVVAHPAVTVATPATSSVEHMIDDLGAAVGRLPDEAMRRRMAEHVAALPG
ncbi:MAG: aldo/keto reductase [Acidobacteria bacterium]|nr:aldo/keto reductase [Acidobacteriota bacterium]